MRLGFSPETAQLATIPLAPGDCPVTARHPVSGQFTRSSQESALVAAHDAQDRWAHSRQAGDAAPLTYRRATSRPGWPGSM